jgi:hypothetical protein
MKQIILRNETNFTGRPLCSTRLALVWGAYGLGAAMLAAFAGPSVYGQAVAWGVALLAGLLLASTLAEG